MAAMSRHLPRGLAHARSATLRSASNLERRISEFSRIGEVENSSLNFGYRGELRRAGTFKPSNFYASGINPPEHSKAVDLRSDRSRVTPRERSLESLRSPGERQLLVLQVHDFSVDHNVRRMSPKASYYTPSTYKVRSVWTAVSAEDKLRSEVDDEEVDLKIAEEHLETTTGNKQDGPIPLDAETSMYASPEGSLQLSTADVNKFLKLSPEDREQYFGEGLPPGLLKEFGETQESAFLIRARVLQLFERFQKCLADTVRLKELKDQGERARFFGEYLFIDELCQPLLGY